MMFSATRPSYYRAVDTDFHRSPSALKTPVPSTVFIVSRKWSPLSNVGKSVAKTVWNVVRELAVGPTARARPYLENVRIRREVKGVP